MREKITLLVDGRPELFDKEEFELAKVAVEDAGAVDNRRNLPEAIRTLRELGITRKTIVLAVVARDELLKELVSLERRIS